MKWILRPVKDSMMKLQKFLNLFAFSDSPEVDAWFVAVDELGVRRIQIYLQL